MSFPKAKIRRFNDVIDVTPAPGKYDPSMKSKPIGAYIPSSDRFKEPQSPALSDAGSTSSANSISFVMPTKPALTRSNSLKFKSRPNATGAAAAAKSKIETSDAEALKDKIVECKNKDAYIEELSKQIEEMKQQIYELNSEKRSGNSEEGAALRENVRELGCEVRTLRRYHEMLTGEARQQISTLMKYVDVDLLSAFANINLAIDALYEEKAKEITGKAEEIETLKTKLTSLEQRQVDAIEELESSHKKYREELEFEMLKSVEESKILVEREKRECASKIAAAETRLVKTRAENDARITQIEENHKETVALVEMQTRERLREAELEFERRLEAQERRSEAILKECQAIGEYNIIQCEVEKNAVKKELEEEKSRCDDLLRENERIAAENERLLGRCETMGKQFEEEAAELTKTRQQLEADLKKAAGEKHTYEVTIAKTHETIEVLKRRLFDSDRDVEQLKAELDKCEEERLRTEGRYYEQVENVRTLQIANEELEMQTEATFEQVQAEIRSVEKCLLEKIEAHKHHAKEYAAELEVKLLKTEEDLQNAMEQLGEQQQLNCEARILIAGANLEIERLETTCTENTYTYKRLESGFLQLQKDLEKALEKESLAEKDSEALRAALKEVQRENEERKMAIEALKEDMKDVGEIRRKYIDQSGKYDQLLQKCEELEKHNATLQSKLREEEALIGPFREQLEAYETELNALHDKNSWAEKEAKDTALKYAKMLGHQNSKQKIKHIVDLKKENLELAENKTELEGKTRAMHKTIEKMKKEIASLKLKLMIQTENKENLGSPVRGANSPGGPLKDRQLLDTMI